MGVIVQKFGGSSVADADKIQHVARKVVATRQAGHAVVVVVSAMGNTTNDLLALARSVDPQASRRELDMLLSVGERISMSLLSMAIQRLGVPAISLTGSQSGIITTDTHTNARIIDVRPFRIQDELARGSVVIVAGYQGTSYRREVTTLGRGGSDTTAVALAGALSADACEIYSDVDGIFTSDPRHVLDAARLDTVTYDEMLELARHGAKVLNAEAVAFAQRHKIALHAKSTHLPDSQGTVVRPDGWPTLALRDAACAPRAVASLPSCVTVEAPQPADEALSAIAEVVGAAELVHVDSAITHTLALIDPTQMPAPAHTLEQLRARFSGLNGTARQDLTNVTLVGREIGLHPEWTLRAVRAWRAAGVEVSRLWSRSNAITALVPVAARAEAMRAAHALVQA
jgi:aspartate kinase